MWLSILVENACKGIGKLGELAFGRKFREKEYLDALMRAQGKRHAKAIEGGELVFIGTRLIPASLLQNVPQAMMLPLVSGMEEEARNLNANLAIAADVLKATPDDQVSDEPVNPDWFARWRREAQVIGDEEMRQIWGRILAEEVKNPHAISLKTLDVLKNITADDAHLFCEVARFRIASLITIDPAPLGEYEAIDLLSLQDLNLITLDLNIRIGACIVGSYGIFKCNGFVLTIIGDNSFVLSHLRGATLTKAGEEICNISDTISPATPEEIKKIGDAVWDGRSPQMREMNAYPITSIKMPELKYNRLAPIHTWAQ